MASHPATYQPSLKPVSFTLRQEDYPDHPETHTTLAGFPHERDSVQSILFGRKGHFLVSCYPQA